MQSTVVCKSSGGWINVHCAFLTVQFAMQCAMCSVQCEILHSACQASAVCKSGVGWINQGSECVSQCIVRFHIVQCAFHYCVQCARVLFGG